MQQRSRRPQITTSGGYSPRAKHRIIEQARKSQRLIDDGYRTQYVAGQVDAYGIVLLQLVQPSAGRSGGWSASLLYRSLARGRWLIVHASCLRDSRGQPAQTAVVIEPAKASQMASIREHPRSLVGPRPPATPGRSTGLSSAQR
jgi:hypothetical protein